jgi:L-malate glycosyltransferase
VSNLDVLAHVGAAHIVNLLFCTLSYYPAVTGGAERQARLQAEELVRRGHQVTVVCGRTGSLGSEEINGVRVIRLRRVNHRPLFRLSYLVRLLHWLALHGDEYDLTHVHLASLQADIAVAAARRHRRPTYVKVACGGSAGETHRFRSMAKLTRWYGLRHADRVQVLSDEIGQELTAIGVSPDRMVKIPNGVDLGEFAPVPEAARLRLRNDLGLPEQAIIVLFVGRLVDYKGIHDLLDAWRCVRAESARLLIVGATDESSMELPQRVLVRGWADSPLAYLQAADVFVHPSHADGMPNAVLEAMACGCAVIATEHGGTNGLLTAGRDALLVPVRNPEALAAGLERVIGDADLRRRLAAHARESVTRHAVGGVVDRIEAEYGTILLTAGSQAGPRGLDDQRAGEITATEKATITN